MASDALKELIAHLTSSDAAAQRAAAQTLVSLGAEAKSAAAALLPLAAAEDETVQIAAVEALENLGPPDVGALPALIESLQTSPAPEVGYWAATLIGRLQASAAPATEALAKTVGDHPAVSVRERAVWALGQIGPAAISARETLESAARDARPRLARLAKESLERIMAGA